MGARRAQGEQRTPEQIREHYEIEKALADRLRSASKDQRRGLYSSLYDELYRRLPRRHPQLTLRMSAWETADAVRSQMRLLRPFLKQETVFLEVGPGDCALSLEATRFVKQVIAIDVSVEIATAPTCPANYQLIISDGSSIPVTPNSVDVAYSNQLMEHLHPADALEQLANVYAALAPGGVYVCVTPNRLSGPHDVSEYFDDVATGLHLKEYTTSELAGLFRRAGFSKISVRIGGRGVYMGVPVLPIAKVESLLARVPRPQRRTIGRSLPFKALLGIRVVGVK